MQWKAALSGQNRKLLCNAPPTHLYWIDPCSRKEHRAGGTTISSPPYYAKDGFELHLTDCISCMEELPEGSVDLVFADPPYNLSNGGFTCHAGRRVPVHKGDWDVSSGAEENFAFHLAWINACRRVLKADGSIWISGTYHSIYACGYALQVAGFHILNDICWFKPNAPPNLSRRYFTASHETLIWARKNAEGKHTFNYEAMKCGDWHEADMLKREGKQMRSVWSISAPRPAEKAHGRHPTQKPLLLLRRILSACTHEGDCVLDPFTGSSTTGLAAYAMHRRFIGIDSDQAYLDLSIRRFEDLQQTRVGHEGEKTRPQGPA
ncbi:MAG TPA: site-specific DNA-methyltransferase [Methanoculleus sp.]|nr:site-specific DNA-methyltransferase [Methanoculleus sp.]